MIGNILKISLFFKIFSFLFIGFIIFNSISIGIKERSIVPIIKDIGGRIFFATYEVQNWSTNIIENQGLYNKENETFFTAMYNLFDVYSNLFILFLWLFIIYKLWSWTPADSGVFFNMFITILIFLTLQILFLLAFKEGNKVELLMIPINSFINLIKAIIVIINPIYNKLPMTEIDVTP